MCHIHILLAFLARRHLHLTPHQTSSQTNNIIHIHMSLQQKLHFSPFSTIPKIEPPFPYLLLPSPIHPFFSAASVFVETEFILLAIWVMLNN